MILRPFTHTVGIRKGLVVSRIGCDGGRADEKPYPWLMRTRGVGVPSKTVSHSLKSVLNASVSRFH